MNYSSTTFLLRLTSVYCVDLLQFAFLHTFSAESVKDRETLQNLAKLRGTYQIMKENFMIKVLFICHGTILTSLKKP